MLQILDGLGANGFTHNGFAEHVRSTKHPGLPTEGRKAEQTASQEHNGAILSKWWGRTFTMAGNTALNSNRRQGTVVPNLNPILSLC